MNRHYRFVLALLCLCFGFPLFASAQPVCPEDSNPENGSCTCFEPGEVYDAGSNTCIAIIVPTAVPPTPEPPTPEPPTSIPPTGVPATDVPAELPPAEANPEQAPPNTPIPTPTLAQVAYLQIFCRNDLFEIWHSAPPRVLLSLNMSFVETLPTDQPIIREGLIITRTSTAFLVSSNPDNPNIAGSPASIGYSTCIDDNFDSGGGYFGDPDPGPFYCGSVVMPAPFLLLSLHRLRRARHWAKKRGLLK